MVKKAEYAWGYKNAKKCMAEGGAGKAAPKPPSKGMPKKPCK